MYKIIFGFLLLLFLGCNSIEKDIPIQQKINTNWQFKAIDTLDWKSAIIPGNVFTDLRSHHIIEDPFVKNNEEKVQWVAKKDWIYQTKYYKEKISN